jgi:hypothetical protein
MHQNEKIAVERTGKAVNILLFYEFFQQRDITAMSIDDRVAKNMKLDVTGNKRAPRRMKQCTADIQLSGIPVIRYRK